MEQELLSKFEAQILELAGLVTDSNHDQIRELLALPQQIRGFGHVKERNIKKAEARRIVLTNTLRESSHQPALAKT